MRTLGIDLAAEAANTAACLIHWAAGAGRIETREGDCGDARLLELAARADHIGIDAPLGWPERFRAALDDHAALRPWPGIGAADAAGFRDTLKYRETDRVLRARGYAPLSVSADKLGVPAMRAALLLGLLAREGRAVARDGSGDVAEVYPAAALRAWGLPHSGYKRGKGRPARETIVAALAGAVPGLDLDAGARAAAIASDHVLDAIISALITRAAALGLTHPPPPELRDAALREGWIHVPVGDAPASLAGGGPQNTS